MWLLPILALLVWIVLLAARLFGQDLSLGWYLLASGILFLDLADLVVRFVVLRRIRQPGGARSPTSLPLAIGRFTPSQVRLHLRPYALLVSVHDAEDALDDFLEAMQPHRDRLWVIDDASRDDTWFRLQRSGVRCFRSETNLRKPGAIRELLKRLPPEIVTVLVLDPDIRILDSGARVSDLERVVFEFQRSGCAAACPRVVVRQDGWLARLQAVEYRLALGIGRRSLAGRSITSGVALYRRDALEAALSDHTLSVYAEDLENALILLGRGECVYYDERLMIETEGKRNWRGWFSQRVGWHYGLLKVYRERFADVRRLARAGPFFAYQFLVYMGLLTLLLHPLRIASLALLLLSTANGVDLLLGLELIPDVAATEPIYFLFAYLKYTALVLVAGLLATRDRAEWLALLSTVPLYFFYVLAHVVPSSVGYANWISLRLAGRRLYRDHYNDEEARFRSHKEAS